MFVRLDKDNTGTLSLQDIEDGFRELKLQNIDKMMENVKLGDSDNCGHINYTEFIAATMDQNFYLNERNVRAAFDMFDKDGCGHIEYEDLVTLLNGE